jgi:hypothetical protein
MQGLKHDEKPNCGGAQVHGAPRQLAGPLPYATPPASLTATVGPIPAEARRRPPATAPARQIALVLYIRGPTPVKIFFAFGFEIFSPV